MTTLGAVYLPQLPPERLASVARAADDAGLEELWLWEDCFLSGGLSMAAIALASTERLRIGIGVLPVPFRNVALAAMELATLDRMFPGRLHLGVGHGVQDWMAQVGAKVESPMTLLREYLSALRALVAGESVTVHGRYVNLDRVKLDWPPLVQPAILCAATGPRTLRLSGELADGTVLTSGTTPDGVRQARELIDQGRSLAARSDKHRLTVYLLAATGPGGAERLERSYASWQFDPAQDVGVAGDAEAVAEAVTRWADVGADAVILQPTEDDPDPEAFVRFVAHEVRPLVR